MTAISLPLEERDLAVTHGAEQIAFKLLSHLEAHGDLIRSSQTSSIVTSMREVVEQFLAQCVIPHADAVFHAFDSFTRDFQPAMTKLVGCDCGCWQFRIEQ